jgi:hypothetical protein
LVVRRKKIGPGLLGTIFSPYFFSFFFLAKKVIFPQKKRQTQTTDLWRSPVPTLTDCGSGLSTYLFFSSFFVGALRSSAHQGKRDKYPCDPE